eukprot:s2032_g14.t1
MSLVPYGLKICEEGTHGYSLTRTEALDCGDCLEGPREVAETAQFQRLEMEKIHRRCKTCVPSCYATLNLSFPNSMAWCFGNLIKGDSLAGPRISGSKV